MEMCRLSEREVVLDPHPSMHSLHTQESKSSPAQVWCLNQSSRCFGKLIIMQQRDHHCTLRDLIQALKAYVMTHKTRVQVPGVLADATESFLSSGYVLAIYK